MSTLTFGFVIVPNFSLIALSACIDPLRLANQGDGPPHVQNGAAVAGWRVGDVE